MNVKKPLTVNKKSSSKIGAEEYDKLTQLIRYDDDDDDADDGDEDEW